jgi:LmbE family N-acetylglucosaminyl deacetylase
MKTILAIGAHYDDVEMGCGGTLCQHVKNGDKVYVAITSSDDPYAGSTKERGKEQKKCDSITGFETIMFKISDPISKVIGKLDLIKPNIIFSMYEKDTHQDHRRAFQIGASVGRKKHITTYTYDSGSAYEFYPNIFNLIDFSEKEKLISCFKSQIERGTVKVDIIKNKEMYWASLVCDDVGAYAEGFVVRKLKYHI